MPVIKTPKSLPAVKVLSQENIFLMDEQRALHQDIRPLHIGIINLMPTKIVTETQLLRLLSNSPLQVEVTFLTMASRESRHTGREHLQAFYKTFDAVRDDKFDGLIVTGAPVEKLDYKEVDYWDELTDIMDWSTHHGFATMFICWAAQAAVYHYYGVEKTPLDEKMFGVFPHRVLNPRHPLMRGFDDVFYAPHSRHTAIRSEDIRAVGELEILAESEEAGALIFSNRDGRRIFVTGHLEYDALTLDTEYRRDLQKGLSIALPRNYYPNGDHNQTPVVTWRSHAHLLYANWLNYFVYQVTPYDINSII